MSESRMTGGCQCGAVRYEVEANPSGAAICHCRMCQKAVGSIVWPFFAVRRDRLTWTRGAPAYFRSSLVALRGFCSACGTPLSFEREDRETLDLGIGTLDRPGGFRPTHQYWLEERMPWFGELDGLPRAGLGSGLADDEQQRRKSFQHPDHDTSEWPPRGGAHGSN